MIYLHAPPAPLLRHYIECYWYASTQGGSLFNEKEIYFPDLRAELYFNFGEPYEYQGYGKVPAGIHLWAPRMQGKSLSNLHGIKFLVVRFTPLGFNHFYTGILSDLHGQKVGFEYLDGNSYQMLLDNLSDKSFHSAIQYLDKYFLGLIADRSYEEKRALHLYNNIISNPYGKIKDFISICGYTYRTANRHFKDIFGIAPKQLQLGAKFNLALNLLKQGEHDIEAISFLAGYYDSSDMSGYFRETVGKSPTELLRSNNLILHALHPRLKRIN